MTNPCAAFGSATKFIVEPESGSFDADSERYLILGENLTKSQPIQGRRRITGDRSNYSDGVRPHSYRVQGAVAMQPGPADMSLWLPRFLWGTGYTLGSTAPEFDCLIDRENGIFRYTDCNVARVVFRSRTEAGNDPSNEELVEMIVYIMATDETVNATAWPDPEPALDLGTARMPYNHSEGVFTLNSNVTGFKNWELTIDNMLQPVYFNGLGPACFRSAGRRISLKAQAAFTTTSLADAVTALNSGVSGSLVLTNGNMSTSFAFPHLRNNYVAPAIRGQGEIPLQLELEAFRTSGSAELVVTHDDNPA